MYGQNSEQEGGAIYGERGMDARHRFSRRVMLGGLAGLVGAGVAGCSLPFGPAQATPTARVLATATHFLPSPPASPTPTPAPRGTTLYIYRGHSNRVNTTVWAPGGKRIASGSGIDTTVQIWDALSGANVVTHHGYGDSGATVTWAPDGKRLASADRTSLNYADDVQVWDAASGQTLKTYPAHTRSPAPGPVNGLSWSPDGKYLASASYDYTVRVWEVATGNIRFLYSDPHGYLMTCVAWSPDGKYIAFGNDDNGTHNVMAQVWNVASQSRVAIFHGHTAPIQSVAWSPDGTYIASGGNDNTARVWHALTGSLLFTYTGHSTTDNIGASVISVAWSPDGKRIASASVDTTVQIWDALRGKLSYKYDGHNATVYAAAWSPDGTYIASCGDDKTVQVWQAV
jgi:WD40 repeat protein